MRIFVMHSASALAVLLWAQLLSGLQITLLYTEALEATSPIAWQFSDMVLVCAVDGMVAVHTSGIQLVCDCLNRQPLRAKSYQAQLGYLHKLYVLRSRTLYPSTLLCRFRFRLYFFHCRSHLLSPRQVCLR
mmetsp:Transcript_27044/g.69580  ORF Transcript_27044/g.69580 Transcript_27044/m.69580 type:complete len:131 (+) Transcript_27044:1552-1944(+)